MSVSRWNVKAAIAGSHFGNRTPDLLHQPGRAVTVAPELDIDPIQPVALDGHHVPDVVCVLVARPAEFADDHVLGRQQPDLPAG